jgi:hypothetical protein
MALNPTTHTPLRRAPRRDRDQRDRHAGPAETTRFSTAPYPDPSSLVIAGGKLWFSCFQSDGEGCLVSAGLNGTGMTPVSGWPFATVLAANGNLLAVADSYQSPPTVTVYNVSGATPSVVSTARPNDSDVASMTFAPSGANLLLATGAPYFIQSLDTSNLLSSAQYPTGPYPVAVAVTADGKYVAGGIHTGTGSGNDVFVYAVGSTSPVRTWRIGDGATELPNHSLAFSPDASRLFAVAEDAATGHLAFHVLSQPTIPLKPSSTSATGSVKTVRYGGRASVKVHLSGPTSGKVDLYATTSAATKQLVAGATATSGAATFTVTPKENTTYVAQFEEGSGYATSASSGVRITVSPVISISTRAGGKGRLHGHRVSKTLFTARVKPARPNEPLGFVVQRHLRRRWRTVSTGRFPADLTGTVHAFFLTNRVGPCRVRVSFAGDADFVTSKSAWKKFRTPSLR